MQFKDRLKIAMKDADNMSQSELARALKVKPQSVQKWAAGTTTPLNKRIDQISRILGCSPGWLATGTGEYKLNSKNEIRETQASYQSPGELAEIYLRMSIKTKETWIKIGKVLLEAEKQA